MFVVGHGLWNTEEGGQSSNDANSKEYHFLQKLIDVRYPDFLSLFLFSFHVLGTTHKALLGLHLYHPLAF